MANKNQKWTNKIGRSTPPVPPTTPQEDYRPLTARLTNYPYDRRQRLAKLWIDQGELTSRERQELTDRTRLPVNPIHRLEETPSTDRDVSRREYAGRSRGTNRRPEQTWAEALDSFGNTPAAEGDRPPSRNPALRGDESNLPGPGRGDLTNVTGTGGDKKVWPEFAAWLADPKNSAFFHGLSREDRIAVQNAMAVYGVNLSPSYLNSLVLRNRYITATNRAALARLNPAALKGKRATQENYNWKGEGAGGGGGGGYPYADYGLGDYGGYGGYGDYTSWLVNLTNWIIK